MTHYDCFNGDADGICALTQLRLSTPQKSELITGVKRDIALLDRIADQVTVEDKVIALDISLDKNRKPLQRILESGAHVFYCDHHYAGEVPRSDNFQSVINTASDVCTSLLINQQLQGKYVEWAVVGTFGDNLSKSAHGLAKSLSLNESQLEKLQNLGIYLNYNGYGASTEDLYFHPAELFLRTSQYETPRLFIEEDVETFSTLEHGYHEDMSKAMGSPYMFDGNAAAVVTLENAAWARRVSGVFGNELANQHPDRAHAVLTHKDDDCYVVSVRAPLNNKTGADEICRQFDTGGGRAAAAGINRLHSADVEDFIRVLSEYYS